ncbi:MAG: oligosaccharide flippase family protein [Bacteroidales bacterium]|nr:oligosaccharide flippase family protein [Bacteroidales bacterium]
MSIWQKIKEFTSSEMTKNSAKLLSASVIVQIIGLLIYPILTRLYSPENFGMINLFLSISGVLTIFSTAEFQYSIVLPKSEERAVACFHVGFFCACAFFVILLCTIPFSESIAQIFNAPDLAHWYWGIPIFVLLSSLWILLNYWYTRQKQFGAISKYQITQCVTNAGAKCGFGFAGFLNGGLIFSALLSPFIALCFSIANMGKKIIKPLFVIDKEENFKALREYANFPKYSLPRAIINYISCNLLILLLTPVFGLTDIGFLGMALTLAFRPINMISESLYKVFYQKTAEHVQNKEHISDFFKRYFTVIFLCIIPLLVIIGFFINEIIVFLLGSMWNETADIILYMMPWLIATCFFSPICYLADVFQKQNIGLFLEILLIVARLAGIFIGIAQNDFHLAILWYSVASLLVTAIQIGWYWMLIRRYELTIED